MSEPIYIAKWSISQSELTELERKTGRPVVLLNEAPDKCVLDKNISLRDMFAAKAMQSLAAYDNHERIAEVSYQLADAMMKERDKL